MLKQPTILARIAIMNKIAQQGLDVFNGTYMVGKDIENPDAIMLRSAKLDTALYPHLLAVGRAGAGVDNIDDGPPFNKANDRGICIFNAPGANARSVAELVIAMVGANARRAFDAVHFCRSLAHYDEARITKMIEENKGQFLGYELESKTIAVIGLGQVGVHVANRAIQAGMHVVGFDIQLTVQNALRLANDPKLSIAKSKEQALRMADIVTVHADLNEKTRHLIGAREIALMKKGVVLVNYARKGIYDDGAVIAAIEEGQVDSYLADHFATELVHTRVFTTPHIGASTPESEERCAVMVAKRLREFFEFGTVANSVNFPTVDPPLHPDTKTRIAIVNRDIPGMIASYTALLGNAGINIPSVPGDTRGPIGYYLIDIDREVPAAVVDAIRSIDGVIRVRAIPMAV